MCNEGRKWDRGNQEKHRKEAAKLKGKGKARDKYINEGTEAEGREAKVKVKRRKRKMFDKKK